MHRGDAVLRGVVAAIYFFVLAPIVIIIGIAFDGSAQYQFPPTDITLRWFYSFFADPAYFGSFLYVSLPIGIMAAVIATSIGTLAALGLTRRDFRFRRAAELFFLTPLLIPEILLAVAWYISALKLDIQHSMMSIVVGHVVIATPLVIRNIMAGLSNADPRLEEAAASLGASPWQIFWRVTFPLLRSSIIAGAIFAFIISFSDLNVSLFLTSPDITPLPVHIFAQIHYADDPTVAAASALQVVLIGLLLALIQLFFKPRLA